MTNKLTDKQRAALQLRVDALGLTVVHDVHRVFENMRGGPYRYGTPIRVSPLVLQAQRFELLP